MKLSFFQKIKLFGKIEKAVKRVKNLAKENEKLGEDLKQAMANLNADIDVLMGLLPSCRDVLGDVKKLINDAMDN
jgi:hypothetical protein